jgi:hypothetical protein
VNKRQRKRHEKDIRHEHFEPGIAEGLTIGVPKKQALEMHPVKTGDASKMISHMRDADKRLNARGRLPYAQFVARDSVDAVWTDGVTDRPQMDYSATYTPEGMRLLREGRQCLRCQEPQPDPFPAGCDMCGYPMKDRQIMDIAMEFEGDRHLGPAKPITEHLENLEQRTEKRKFIDKQVEKGSIGRIPKSFLRDAHLFPEGPPKELL